MRASRNLAKANLLAQSVFSFAMLFDRSPPIVLRAEGVPTHLKKALNLRAPRLALV